MGRKKKAKKAVNSTYQFERQLKHFTRNFLLALSSFSKLNSMTLRRYGVRYFIQQKYRFSLVFSNFHQITRASPRTSLSSISLFRYFLFFFCFVSFRFFFFFIATSMRSQDNSFVTVNENSFGRTINDARRWKLYAYIRAKCKTIGGSRRVNGTIPVATLSLAFIARFVIETRLTELLSLQMHLSF